MPTAPATPHQADPPRDELSWLVRESQRVGSTLEAKRLKAEILQRVNPGLRWAARSFGPKRGTLGLADLVQTGSLEVLRALERFDGRRPFATYALDAARRAMRDLIRGQAQDVHPSDGAARGRTKTGRPGPLAQLEFTERDLPGEPPPTPEELATSAEGLKRLRNAMAQLRPFLREILERHYGLGGLRSWSLKEHARRLGISVPRLDLHIEFAKAQLRRLLEEK